MSIPPILVALAISPMTALWVTIFMLALDEIMGDLILPKLRSNTMKIHPVSILFVLLAMATVFGFMGALLATAITALIKAYYEAFYANRLPADAKLEERIGFILYKDKEGPNRESSIGPPHKARHTNGTIKQKHSLKESFSILLIPFFLVNLSTVLPIPNSFFLSTIICPLSTSSFFLLRRQLVKASQIGELCSG